MAMSDCALTVHLVIYSTGIYTVVSLISEGIVLRWIYIMKMTV